MTDWKQKIEAQIASLQAVAQGPYGEKYVESNAAHTMQALLDVAAAADNAAPLIGDEYVGKQILDAALDKLKGKSDEGHD